MTNSLNSIEIINVTKSYYFEKPRTLKKWVSSMLKPYGKFTVINNFSLKVGKGEFVVITGLNGCGKTTLLKLMAGITVPDKGKIITSGKIVPLIELGAGFNYELTGRENIAINATILGIDKKTIETIINSIITYSGLRRFIDIPIKRYSSGMISRLAFSIAAFAKPDILLLDEIFAACDMNFKLKSKKKLESFRRKKITIVLTAHSVETLKIKPDRIVMLEKLK